VFPIDCFLYIIFPIDCIIKQSHLLFSVEIDDQIPVETRRRDRARPLQRSGQGNVSPEVSLYVFPIDGFLVYVFPVDCIMKRSHLFFYLRESMIIFPPRPVVASVLAPSNALIKVMSPLQSLYMFPLYTAGLYT